LHVGPAANELGVQRVRVADIELRRADTAMLRSSHDQQQTDPVAVHDADVVLLVVDFKAEDVAVRQVDSALSADGERPATLSGTIASCSRRTKRCARDDRSVAAMAV
jgi:hypothetical protein